MGRFSHPLCTSTRRFLLAIGIAAATLLAPTTGWALDPVDRLREALRIRDTDEQQISESDRLDMVKRIVPELKTFSQLRRAYFLSGWKAYEKADRVDPKLDKIDPKQKKADPSDALLEQRKQIGEMLKGAIQKAATEPNVNKQIAVAMMIAEFADSEKPAERTKRETAGKFGSAFFTDLLLGTKTSPGLIHNEDVRVRQVSLNALGKIVPKPGPAIAALKSVLEHADKDLGPRRLAAYALTDLLKNASNFMNRKEEMQTLNGVVGLAVFGLRNQERDEQVRGYCLQALILSTRSFTDYPILGEHPIELVEVKDDAKKDMLDPEVQKVLKSYQDANSRILSILKDDASINIRLTALEALTQIARARSSSLQQLRRPGENRGNAELLNAYQIPDPIRSILVADWVVIPGLLKRDEDVRLRRDAMAFLEMVADELVAPEPKRVGPTVRNRLVKAITPALSDPDRFVRWSALRTLRTAAPGEVDGTVIDALLTPLRGTGGPEERGERDTDLTRETIAAIDVLGPAINLQSERDKQAVVDVLADVIANSTSDAQDFFQWDASNRVAAMKAVVSIGGPTAERAMPALVSALPDADVRVRRASAESIGILGGPANRALAERAVAALRERLQKDDDAEVRLNASEAILSITVPSK